MKLTEQLFGELKSKINWAYFSRIFFLLLMLYTLIVTAWVGDDAQITFRQIWNFINGEGITFNFEQRVQSFTHPLWFFTLSYISIFTRELFQTTLIFSIFITMAAILLLFKIEFSSSKRQLAVASPIFTLVLSWAFCDYATSGLENPLSYFLVGLLLYIFSLQNWSNHLMKIYLVLALLVLNRYDYALLFLPFAVMIATQTKDVKGFLRAVWPGALLILMWVLFATFYFGSPLPNSFFAKLNADYPFNEVLERGRHYFASLRLDLMTIIIILSGFILAICSNNRYLISLVVGQVLYFMYVVIIGGDFMQGRFFAVPTFLSVGLLVLVLAKSEIWSEIKTKKYLTIFLIVCLHIGAIKEFPFASGRDYEGRQTIKQIFDERGFYYAQYGLVAKHRDFWPSIADPAIEKPEEYKTSCGFIGSYSLLDTSYHLVDICDLSDPFISRLPAVQTSNWKTGHNIR